MELAIAFPSISSYLPETEMFSPIFISEIGFNDNLLFFRIFSNSLTSSFDEFLVKTVSLSNPMTVSSKSSCKTCNAELSTSSVWFSALTQPNVNNIKNKNINTCFICIFFTPIQSITLNNYQIKYPEY